MSKLQFHLLNNNQLFVFERLKVFQKEAALAGGTALMLQIGHRYSYDFDVFFSRKLERNDLVKLRRVLKIKEVGLNTQNQINIVTANNILINLVFYPFRSLSPQVKTNSLALFSVKDIAADKAFTIGRRATWRDYVDIFFLLKYNSVAIPEIFKLAKKKFGFEFNERLFLEQLSYFQDTETTKISFVKKKIPDSEIKKFLIQTTQKSKNIYGI